MIHYDMSGLREGICCTQLVSRTDQERVNLPFSPPWTTSTAVLVRIKALVSGEFSMYLRTLSADLGSRIAFRRSAGISFA